jgi:hypothetical protein
MHPGRSHCIAVPPLLAHAPDDPWADYQQAVNTAVRRDLWNQTGWFPQLPHVAETAELARIHRLSVRCGVPLPGGAEITTRLVAA